MLETVGKKLAKARAAKNLTIEDVEHRTRIPHERLRELEDDDYSRFANLTYAKSFLKLYSDYLSVDTTDYRQELSLYEVDDFGANPLANEFAEEEEPKRHPRAFIGVVLLLLAALGTAYYMIEYHPKDLEGNDPKEVATGVGNGADGDGGGELNPNAKPPGEKPEEDIRPARPVNLNELPATQGGFEPPVPGTETDLMPVVPAVPIEDDLPAPALPVNPSDE